MNRARNTPASDRSPRPVELAQSEVAATSLASALPEPGAATLNLSWVRGHFPFDRLALAVGAVAALLMLRLSGQTIVLIAGAAAIGAAAWSIVVHQPIRRGPWIAIVGGVAVMLVADISQGGGPPIFGWREATQLGARGLIVAGLVWMIRIRHPRGDISALIDAAIIGLGFGTLGWVFTVAPHLAERGLTGSGRLTVAAFPVLDLLIAVLAVRLLACGGVRDTAALRIALAAPMLFAADALGAFGALNPVGGVMEASGEARLAFVVLLAAAALHPTMRSLVERAPAREPVIASARLMLLVLAVLLGPTVLAVQAARGIRSNIPVFIAVSGILALLVLVRIAGLIAVLGSTADRHRRAVVRETTLRRAAANLVAAADRTAVHMVTERTAIALAEGSSGEAVRLIMDRDAGLGFDRDVTTGNFAALPEGIRQRLDRGESVVLTEASERVRTAVAVPPDRGGLFLSPLIVNDVLRGIVVMPSRLEIDEEVANALQTLASQAALALETIELTEYVRGKAGAERFRSLVQHASDVITITDAAGVIREQTPSVQRVLGYGQAALVGTAFTDILHQDDQVRFADTLADAAAQPRIGITFSGLARHVSGHWRNIETVVTNLLEDPNVRGFVLTTRDVTDQKALEKRLFHQAFHDPLTGLANRRLFTERVEKALQLRSLGESVSVLFFDLDDFKTVNDSLGHQAGDELLVSAADRLRGALSPGELASRLGGDEFAVLVARDDETASRARAIAAATTVALKPAFLVGDREVIVRASVGIALSMETGTAEELLRDADAAMFAAKEAGKGGYRVFEASMHESVMARLELKADLERAVEGEQFVVHYQPLVDLATGRLRGLEALVRWNHPTRGLISPSHFIPAAEESGLILPLGKYVLFEALRQTGEWRRKTRASNLYVSVNAAARQIQHPDFVDLVAEALEAAGVPGEALVLEMTETTLMDETEQVVAVMQRLSKLGVRIALDDFGTGYSSLAYLRRFPIHQLKIDRSFVSGIQRYGDDDAELVRAIIGIGRGLGLSTLAEGIERPEQRDILRQLECDFGQGHLFGHAVPGWRIGELFSAAPVVATRPTRRAVDSAVSR